ncbi:MAG: GDSL family lipase [Phycisphaerae bacterium]|nr:GDSL family lipase [Phycisphaerae bacterium]
MRVRNTVILGVLAAVLVCVSGCTSTPTAAETAFAQVALKTHSAVTPETQKAKWAESWWLPRHNSINQRFAQGHVDLIMIGDSIIHHWDKELWARYYAPRNAVNMGFGGDRTQHVLWRLENGNLDGINPKLAVIMIGTNNSNDNTAEEIADGIIAICGKVREKLPKTKILLLAIFPRNATPDDPQRQKNAAASAIASKIADGKMIHYMDINPKFLTEDQVLSREIMPDLLHPNKKGYQIWMDAIEPKIRELMAR